MKDRPGSTPNTKKGKYVSAFLFICSVLLTVGFAVRLYFDYTLQYEFGSAPFWLYAAVRFCEYMLPAIGCLAVGIIVRKKAKEKEQNEEQQNI